MPRFLDTTGNSNLAVFICPRCRRKRPYVDMVTDPNTGLKVCTEDCADLLDPYRKPARRAENISLRYPRPDEPLEISEIYNIILDEGGYWITDKGEFVIIDDNQILPEQVLLVDVNTIGYWANESGVFVTPEVKE